MTDAQKVECIEAWLGRPATKQDLAEHLYGRTGERLTKSEETEQLEETLKGSPNDWRLKTLSLIQQIPTGHLISYGNLARWANKEFGLNIGPRNTAWLRKKVYWTVGHNTDIPIHRVADQDDTKSNKDHPVTQNINKCKRGEEGSFDNPVWLHK